MTTGSIKSTGEGKKRRWSFTVDVPTPDGRRRQVHKRGFLREKDARDAMLEAVSSAVSGLRIDVSTMTVGMWLDRWLKSAESRVRPTTLDAYRRVTRIHIKPTLGAVKLQQLHRAQVAAWIDELSSRGLAPKYVRNVHGVLSKALGDALDVGLVSVNAASRPKALPRANAPAPRAWTTKQLVAFLDGTGDDRLAPVWRLIAGTGCRRGEALGLRWADVDLDGGTVTITRQRAIAGGSIVEGAPKTNAGARTIALDAGTVRSLRAWRKVQAAERLVMGAGWRDTELVFTNPDGGGIWPTTLTARFRADAGRLKLPKIGVHGLRHTAATFMVGAGISPKVVQQRLGHAHVSVTLGLYSHVLPSHDREAADALGRALDRA